MIRWVVVGALVSAACGDPWIDRKTQVGYDPNGASATLPLTRAIQTSRIPTDVPSTTHDDASVFIIDLDEDALTYRQLLGIVVTYDAEALTVSAAFADDPCRTGSFAFVLLDSIRDLAGEPIGRTRTFDDAFELRKNDPSGGAFRPLRAALVDAQIDLGSVAGATLLHAATNGCE